jgi:imidazolonepropionase-like amidohydrolase
MTVLRVRGVVLPDREERSFWIDGDRLHTEPVPDSEPVVEGGWLLPGLVDVHTHPSTIILRGRVIRARGRGVG